jgi:hypothetical protein
VPSTPTEERGLAEESAESRWEAAPAVLVVILLQALLAAASAEGRWRLWHLPWWVWLVLVVPEAILLAALALAGPRQQLEQLGRRRTVSVMTLALVSAGNGLALVFLLGSLLEGHETSGGELLLKAGVIWATNVIAFGLWFWAFDRGGPVARIEPATPPPDFSFPQMSDPQNAPAHWRPELLDYLYVSLTNSIAFSPTDTMPLTRTAKALMSLEACMSAVTILLVAARAVNILR